MTIHPGAALREIAGPLVLEPRRFRDERGYFEETWNRQSFRDAGIDVDFVQDNCSMSVEPGTLRGLHFQAPPHAQDKLVRCARGAIFDVAVDIRRGSPTYGRWVAVELTPENGKQFFVPKGFLHGFVTLLPGTEVQYKCSDFYAPDSDGSVLWNSLDIAWPLGREPILSAKDARAPAFRDFESPFVFGDDA
jgi:dTDP-4-dehydrorhamnose 3,5-epimerase